MPRLTVFAQWLYDARTERGLTMTVLADRAGISHARIVQLEKGDLPTRDMVERLVVGLLAKDSDEYVSRTLLNAGIKAAFPRPEDAEGDDLETLVLKAGYNPDTLDEEGRERLRQSVDAAVIGVMEQEKRKKRT